MKIFYEDLISQINVTDFKVRLRLVHGSLTDLSISEHSFLLKYVSETENRRVGYGQLGGQKCFKREEKRKDLKKENPESDHCCGGDRNIRSGGLQESETAMAATTETDNVQQTEVKNRSTALCGLISWNAF